MTTCQLRLAFLPGKALYRTAAWKAGQSTQHDKVLQKSPSHGSEAARSTMLDHPATRVAAGFPMLKLTRVLNLQTRPNRCQ
jgi:hypothetical protein